MKRPNITPGEWKQNVDTVWVEAGTITCFPHHAEKSIANAQAIAALPDLLEAMENALPWLHCEKNNAKGPHAKIAAALIKAGYTF